MLFTETCHSAVLSCYIIATYRVPGVAYASPLPQILSSTPRCVHSNNLSVLGQPKIRRLSTTQAVPKLQAFLSKTIILPHQGAWNLRNWSDQNKTLPLFLETKTTGCSHESSRCFTYFPSAVSVLPTFLGLFFG